MSDKELVSKEKVKHAGIFDFSGFYMYIHSWLKDEKGYSVNEDRYNESVKGDKRDLYIEWKATRGISDYFKIEMEFKIKVNGMADVDVEIDGAEKKMNKGVVDVEIKGNLIKDPDSKWEKAPFHRFLRDVYNKYIIPSRLESMQALVNGHVVELKEEMKAFLELSGKR